MPTTRFSTEAIETNMQSEAAINATLAERYSTTAAERHAHFEGKLQTEMIEVMQKEATLVAALDTELAKLGLKEEPQTTFEPSEFLDFALRQSHLLLQMHANKGSLDRDRFKVTENFAILFNESEFGEKPYYLSAGGNKIELCSFLLQRGIDILHVDDAKLKALVNGNALAVFDALTDTIYKGQEKLSHIMHEERDSYAVDLKQELSQITISLVEAPSADSLARLKQVFELYAHILGRFTSEHFSLIPEFQKLINAKKTLSVETNARLNTFFEENEKLIFKVLGEDCFFEILDKSGDYEVAYRELFGYSGKDIWERRNRNWRAVNTYLTEEVASRGHLEVDDLRNIHILSTKGILPFFCQGFRTDRAIGWYSLEHSKRTVTIGSDVSTMPVELLDDALNLLVSKANAVVHSKYPHVMAEVAWGNLFAEYAVIHPHPDGNGTNAVFFIEALKVLRGNYTPPEKYEENYIKRVDVALNRNIVAKAIGYVRLRSYELTHRLHEDETDKKE